MSTSRRNFLKLSAVVGGSLSLGLLPGASDLLAAGTKLDASMGKAVVTSKTSSK